MYSDVATKYGLEASLSTNNRKLWPRIKTLIKFLSTCVFFYLVIEWFWHSIKVDYKAPIKDFVPCLPNAQPYSRLIEMINLTTGQTRCSSQYQTEAQPCLCCLLGECWRDYLITPFSNSTTLATVVDKVNGIKYERKVPKHAEFCYMMWNSTSYNLCVKETGQKIAYLLRAREKLYGWAPAGLVIDS